MIHPHIELNHLPNRLTHNIHIYQISQPCKQSVNIFHYHDHAVQAKDCEVFCATHTNVNKFGSLVHYNKGWMGMYTRWKKYTRYVNTTMWTGIHNKGHFCQCEWQREQNGWGKTYFELSTNRNSFNKLAKKSLNINVALM